VRATEPGWKSVIFFVAARAALISEAVIETKSFNWKISILLQAYWARSGCPLNGLWTLE